MTDMGDNVVAAYIKDADWVGRHSERRTHMNNRRTTRSHRVARRLSQRVAKDEVRYHELRLRDGTSLFMPFVDSNIPLD